MMSTDRCEALSLLYWVFAILARDGAGNELLTTPSTSFYQVPYILSSDNLVTCSEIILTLLNTFGSAFKWAFRSKPQSLDFCGSKCYLVKAY